MGLCFNCGSEWGIAAAEDVLIIYREPGELGFFNGTIGHWPPGRIANLNEMKFKEI